MEEFQVEGTVYKKARIPGTKEVLCVSLRSEQETDGSLKLSLFHWGFIYEGTNFGDVGQI